MLSECHCNQEVRCRGDGATTQARFVELMCRADDQVFKQAAGSTAELYTRCPSPFAWAAGARCNVSLMSMRRLGEC